MAQAAHELEHLLGLRDAEGRGRLVENHKLRVPHHGAGDGDGLALATGKRRDRLADRLDGRDRERLERLGRVLLHRRLGQDLRATDLTAEIHVLDDVEVVAEREILVDDLDPEPGSVLRPVDVHLFPLEQDPAAVSGVSAGDALDERRLAGAVVADERHHLAGADLEVHVYEGLDRTEGLGDVAQLEKWLVAHRSLLPRRGECGGGARSGASTISQRTSCFYLQYFLYWPMHTSLFFNHFCLKSVV